ncbi:hypothetical protein ACFLY5_01045 [Patescibacteria group bacterium]
MADDAEEIKRLLRKNLEVSKETLKYSKKVYKSQRWTKWLQIAYWMIIIGMVLGVYYYIQPLIGDVVDTYKGVVEDITTLGGLRK